MNKEIKFYILICITLIFPIISVEDIVPWVVSLLFIHKSIKSFKSTREIKFTIKNTLLAGGIILTYNVITKAIQDYLVGLWL